VDEGRSLQKQHRLKRRRKKDMGATGREEKGREGAGAGKTGRRRGGALQLLFDL